MGEKRTSVRQVCAAMGFSESTVKSWKSRKGFSFGLDGRGKPDSLSREQAEHLARTISYVKQGLSVELAYTAGTQIIITPDLSPIYQSILTLTPPTHGDKNG